MDYANSHPHHQDQILGSPSWTSPAPILNNSGSPAMTSSQYSSDMAAAALHSWTVNQDLEEDLGTKMLMKSYSFSGNNNNYGAQGDLLRHHHHQHSQGMNQILPSMNVSNLSQMGSLDMNLEAIDLLASSRFGGNFCHPSSNTQIGILRDGYSTYGLDHNMQQLHQIPLFGSNKVSASSNGALETKRNSIKLEQKAPFSTAPKKSRLEVRASCPPFKVRKEKLGDRIAALQQLVAPFGKTDTASVLKEAIGYIKFLHNQVETLSVPYMKSSRNKPTRLIKMGGDTTEGSGEETTRRDLNNRGLCLVPLSCLSYITDGGGAVVWHPLPPHFGGGAT